MNLFAVNLLDIRGRLEGVPLVEAVRAQRVLPDTLKVWVTERVAIARLGPEISAYPLAIDRHGYVLGPSARHPGLPQLTGLPMSQLRPGKRAEAPELADALEILDLCDTDPALSRVFHIARIDIADVDILKLYLDRDRYVELSRKEMDKQLRDLAVTLQTQDATGASWTNFNFTVQRNQAVR